jgi:hypothetical protein
MTKQPELPDFYRDLEIMQSLNRTMGQVTESGERHEAVDIAEIPDESNS